jgi:hypothetical protein
VVGLVELFRLRMSSRADWHYFLLEIAIEFLMLLLAEIEPPSVWWMPILWPADVEELVVWSHPSNSE